VMHSGSSSEGSSVKVQDEVGCGRRLGEICALSAAAAREVLERLGGRSRVSAVSEEILFGALLLSPFSRKAPAARTKKYGDAARFKRSENGVKKYLEWFGDQESVTLPEALQSFDTGAFRKRLCSSIPDGS